MNIALSAALTVVLVAFARAGEPGTPPPASAVGASGNGTVVLDFRDDATPDVAARDADRPAAIIDAVLDDAPPSAVVTSRIQGSFTAPGREQTAVIIVPDGPSTINPHPTPSTLAVLEGDDVVARHDFAVADAGWQWLRAPVDSDGDGIDELLATASWFQMGQSGTALLHASMAGGAFRRLGTIDPVHISNCALATARPDERKAVAHVVRVAQGGLTTDGYEARCPEAGPDGTGREPGAADFHPLPANAGTPADE